MRAQRATDRIPTQVSPDILDTIGKSFRFKHAKGVAEWLKNSLDSYLRLREQGREPKAGSWPVFLDLIDAQSPGRNGPNLAVVDFGGVTESSIESFFLNWGSRSAATLGGQSTAAVTGGHGNGGKFYMREMWSNGARFLTWRDGLATSLIVDKKESTSTGEWELRDARITWQEALGHAFSAGDGLLGPEHILAYLAENRPDLKRELDAGQRGLTVVVGRKAVQLSSSNDVVRGGRWDHQKLIDEIRDASQARRPIRELSISVFVNKDLRIEHLRPEVLEEDPEWPYRAFELPSSLIRDSLFVGGDESIGTVTIRKAANQLVGRSRHLNAMFVTDRQGNPVASYPIRELPLSGHSAVLPFFQAELQLTFPQTDQLVENDRERLVGSATTDAILSFVADRIWEYCADIEDAQQKTQNRSELRIASVLNDALNHHAKRFLQELQTQIMVDLIDDDEGGGIGNKGDGVGPVGEGPGGKEPRTSGRGGSYGAGGTREVPGTAEPSRKPRFPQVLLSEIDADPSRTDGSPKHLTDRHPPLEQEDIDKQYNVWWINTLHPFAQAALNHGGAKGHAFKSHQLFMFRDVVQREALRFLQRREAELGLDVIENELSEITNRFLAELPHDLVTELLG